MDTNSKSIPVTNADEESLPPEVVQIEAMPPPEDAVMPADTATAADSVPSAPEVVEEPAITAEEAPIVEEPPVEESEVAPAPMESSEELVRAPEDTAVPPNDEPPKEPTNADDEALPGSQIVTPAVGSSIANKPESKPKKSGKGIIIAVAVGIAVVLAAAAVLFFLKNKDSTKTDAKTADKTTQTTVAPKTPVTAADVDTTTKVMDTTLGTLDNNKDFGADTLSDKSLGLQ